MAEKVRVGLAIESQDAEAINNLLKFAKAQDKVGESTRKTNQEARGQTSQVGALQGAWSKAVAAMGGMVSVAGVIQGVRATVNALKESWEENQQAVEENIAALSRFSAISTLSPEDRALVLGNVGQMNVGQAASIAFSARSGMMDTDAIVDVLREASQAKQMGEDPEMFARSIIALQQGVFSDRTVSQISNFFATMAEKSPLSADMYAPQFTRVAGIAGVTAEEKAAGGALMSGIVKAMGADDNPALASTAAKGFLVKRKTVGGEFLESLGLGGKSVPEQIAGLAELAQSEEWTKEQITKGPGGAVTKTSLEKQFLEAFGERTAPALMTLLRSPAALEGIAPDTAAGVAALESTGPSMMAQKAEQAAMQDPQWAMQQEALKIKAAREAANVMRGFTQSHKEKTKQEFAAEYEKEELPLWGEAGHAFVGGSGHIYKRMFSEFYGFGNPLIAGMKELAEWVSAVRENKEAMEKNTAALQAPAHGPAVVDTGGTVE